MIYLTTIQHIIKNMIGIEMDFEISSDDIDLSHKAGVPSSGKNRPIIIKFIRYNDRRRIFTNKKILKGGDLSITKVRDKAIKKRLEINSVLEMLKHPMER